MLTIGLHPTPCRWLRASLITLGRRLGIAAITKNRRYEAHSDKLNDQRIVDAAAVLAPCTLPQQAYGPNPIVWASGVKPPVWVWITWRDGPATKIPAVAAGHNDRVVIVEWEAPGGLRSVVVWRNAVTHRATGPQQSRQAGGPPPASKS